MGRPLPDAPGRQIFQFPFRRNVYTCQSPWFCPEAAQAPRINELGYAGMNTTTGDAIYLMESDMGWFEPKRSKPPLPRHEGLYDDLKPMIVPPTGTKNLYYSSSGLRAQWRKAGEALRNASSVTLFGYSFPATDLAARHFFAGNVPRVP